MKINCDEAVPKYAFSGMFFYIYETLAIIEFIQFWMCSLRPVRVISLTTVF